MTSTAARIDSDTIIKRAFEQPQWYLTKTAYNIKVRIETIREFVGGQVPKNILDIGCGDGSLSLHLLDAGNRITLLDRSKSMLEIAASRIPGGGAGRVETINAGFLEADLPARSFDLILCVGVLAYVQDRQAFIAKLASLLAPNGTLILECTDGNHFVTHLIRAYKSLKAKFGGGEFPTVTRPSSELLAMVSAAGFQRRGSFRYSLPLPGLRKLLSQELSYKGIRLIFGSAASNRLARLGNECIYHFVKP